MAKRLISNDKKLDRLKVIRVVKRFAGIWPKWPNSEISFLFCFKRETLCKYLVKMPGLAKWINSDLSRGFTLSQVAVSLFCLFPFLLSPLTLVSIRAFYSPSALFVRGALNMSFVVLWNQTISFITITTTQIVIDHLIQRSPLSTAQ